MTTAIAKRAPARDLEAERSVLGGILIDNAALDRALEEMSADDFFHEPHRLIFEAAVALAGRGQPADELTVAEQLRSAGSLEKVGGITALGGLAHSTPTAANVRAYARIVRDRATLRRLHSVAVGIQNSATRGEGDVASIMDNAEQLILGLSLKRHAGQVRDAKTVAAATFRRLEALAAKGEDITGVPTGFAAFDNLTAGLQFTNFSILGARPGVGKTAFVLNVIRHAALERKIPCVVFSLEMSEEQLMSRLFAQQGGVRMNSLRNGQLSTGEWVATAQAAADISEAPLFIDDTADMTIFDLRSKVRAVVKRHNVRLVIIDYLQLMSGSGAAEYRDRVGDLAEISRGVKKLAKDTDTHIMALAQLNRGLESRSDKRPMMSDLKDCGGFEQDADDVFFLYRDDVYDKNSPDKGTAEIITGKQRNGPTGTVRLKWIPYLNKFVDMADDENTQPLLPTPNNPPASEPRKPRPMPKQSQPTLPVDTSPGASQE